MPRPPRPRPPATAVAWEGPPTLPPTWEQGRRSDAGELERRKGLLGRSRVGAIAATTTLVGIAAILTAILFAAVANLGSRDNAAPKLTAVPQDQDALQVVRSDPLERAQVLAYLSVPGRLGLNGPAELGVPVLGNAVPLGQGSVTAGDTLRVCTLAPAPAVELTLVDAASGTIVGSHTFLAAPVCPYDPSLPLT